MNAEIQTVAALTVVVLAVLYLVRSAIGKRRQPGCGSGGCPTDRFKQSLKR